MTQKIKDILKKFVLPRSQNIDNARREFILNILLVASLALVSIGLLLQVIVRVSRSLNSEAYNNNTMSFWIVFAIFVFLIFLYVLSRKGYARLSSFLLLLSFFLLASYMGYKWGVELPAELLFYVLIIVMSGILISTRFAFFTTFLIASTMATINYYHRMGIIEVNHYWRTTLWGSTDIIVASTVLVIIATVSWLSNREIERSLDRARRSEADLKKERDLLEIKVEERTRELKEVQIEKMAQLSRFAEFGRLSSGLFHDLMNPLTAVSLNMSRIKSEPGDGEGIVNAKLYLEKAMEATKRMEEFILAVRKQMSNQENKTFFSLNDEIKQVVEILSYKATKADVKINFSSQQEIKTYADAVKFSQVAANLVVNAIDAYEGMEKCSDGDPSKEVAIILSKEKETINLIVKDKGKGIPKECVSKIFDMYFTTKGFDRGMGIGLPLTKNIVEKDFEGSIEVESAKGTGTKFIIRFPMKEDHAKFHK